MTDVIRFESQNNIPINVLGYEKSEIYLWHLTKERGLRHVDLLVLSKGDKSHYCWIKNFNRLMNNQQGLAGTEWIGRCREYHDYK